MSDDSPPPVAETWRDRIFAALREYGYLNPRQRARAPEVLTLRCKQCWSPDQGQATPKARVLGVVIQTSKGFLLRTDHRRRRQRAIDRSDPAAEWRDVGRKTIPYWHFLGDPLGPSPVWFATCDIHSHIPLPSQSDLAAAARCRTVTHLDI